MTKQTNKEFVEDHLYYGRENIENLLIRITYLEKRSPEVSKQFKLSESKKCLEQLQEKLVKMGLHIKTHEVK